jgi:hypothetical protein
MPAPPPPPARDRRVSGILLIVTLILLGLWAAAVYAWRAPKLIGEMKAERAALPSTSEGRLDRWLEFGSGLIHQRLVQVRHSAQQPWLVSYVVTSPGAENEIWGIDLSDLHPSASRREGLSVVVSLAPARLLGRGELSGDKALQVPRYAPGAARPHPDRRAEAVAAWALRPLAEALAKDIPGAELRVQVGDAPPPDAER